ncbi:MAG: hypothetical protein AABZ73_07610 [Pseudomonadota bacterium]|uniref:hypothetical protein n=1 Tax=Sphingobium sp. TaxID=1912891 RepID=UPI002E22A039
MLRCFIKTISTAIALTFAGQSLAADRLDCMSLPMGEAEQELTNRHYAANRGEDRRNETISIMLQSRAKVCSYLYNWSARAAKLAAHYQWLQIQNRALKRFSHYTDEEVVRLNAALSPRRDRLIALFQPSVDAVVGNDVPPPPADGMFSGFRGMIKEAKISRENDDPINLDIWLYEQGFIAALAKEFSKS